MSLFTLCAHKGCVQDQVMDLVLLGGPYLCAQHQAQADSDAAQARRLTLLLGLKAQYVQFLAAQQPAPASTQGRRYVA